MSINTEKVNKTILESKPELIVQLFEVDFSILEGSIGNFLFHPGEVDKFQSGSILFNKKRYIPLPCSVDGFELLGDGKLPRPKITIANYNGIVSKYLKSFGELTGCKVTRIRTFLKFIDKENFPDNINPYGDSDFSAQFQNDVYYINNKISESKHSVEFELVSILELEQVFLPSRQIMSSYCNWIYRSTIGCGYKGGCVATIDDQKFSDHASLQNKKLINPVAWDKSTNYAVGQQVFLSNTVSNKNYNENLIKTDSYYTCIQAHQNKLPNISPEHWLKDDCSKTLKGCKCRFENGALPFGGFPGTEKFGFR